ncbi:Filamin-interacting protein FAM101B [Liparis tanakae]|uniref:Filamin-interacting protein FAM101B n=1 Tax=Liparis tanakae TaxID=230148 RepID=A0A4Z2EY52_9TELE|nr:Filamin-interacting protein FAM101B [Liparis tanakae]
MVGRLNLPGGCEGDPLGVSCGADRGLDSPDSGLPPSPSPGAWLQPACADKTPGGASPVSEEEEEEEEEGGGRGSMVPVVPSVSLQRLQPRSYGEGIALDPLPSTEMRFTSSVRYDSSRHFIQAVSLWPTGLAVERCAQTVTAVPHSTWRRYKTQLELRPRLRPQRFQSTAIVFPKAASARYATELSYDGRRRARRFVSSVELEAAAGRPRPLAEGEGPVL